jgi:hypothetical protein
MMRGAILAAFCLVGCAHTQQRDAEIAAAKKCAAIQIFPAGMSPNLPYRVIGPVSVAHDDIQAHREQALQESACQLEADAVIEVNDFTIRDWVLGLNASSNGERVVDVVGLAIAWNK